MIPLDVAKAFSNFISKKGPTSNILIYTDKGSEFLWGESTDSKNALQVSWNDSDYFTHGGHFFIRRLDLLDYIEEEGQIDLPTYRRVKNFPDIGSMFTKLKARDPVRGDYWYLKGAQFLKAAMAMEDMNIETSNFLFESGKHSDEPILIQLTEDEGHINEVHIALSTLEEEDY
jgi:hypothetical protein